MDRYDELIKLTTKYSEAYYDNDAPLISDAEYDALVREIKEIEREHPEFISPDSPTQKVGGTAKRKAGVLIPHRVPMLSMQDMFTKEEVYKFYSDAKEKLGDDAEFLVETKIDGLSMSLRYENGNLVTAVTRGDGRAFGEDVTENAKVISDIKKKLKNPIEYLEIRGEVYMKTENFLRVNENQELLGKKKFANPRNCAAGTLRQLDSAVTKERGLSMFVFNVQDAVGKSFNKHSEWYEFLHSCGVVTIDKYFVCKTFEEIWDAIEKIGAMRGDLGYDIDGAVIKLNDIASRRLFPDTEKNAGYMAAYKYPPEEKETVLRDIEVSVGRTGRITPTAVFDPVYLCGTTVTRATLHNQDYIDDLDARIGDTILVYKSGEIIPKVKAVIKEKRPENAVPFRLPDTCPVCGAKTVREEGSADIRCTGTSCPAQLERHIINFVGRDAMDIKGFGEVIVRKLIENHYIASVCDIYDLYKFKDELIESGIIGKTKSVENLLASIDKSKNNPPERLLTGLGIGNIGKAAAKELIAHFGSFAKIAEADIEALLEVNDVGAIMAHTVYDWFRDDNNKLLVENLEAHGLKTVGEIKRADGPLSGLTFVITGTLPDMGRDEAQSLIESAGGKVSSSVSKKTSYLLAGENAGSKLTKANSLGVPVIDLPMLKGMIDA